MLYINTKNQNRDGVTVKKSDKAPSEYVIRDDDWKKMLDACEETQPNNPRWERDYALIFLGAALGMRRGEICLFERNHFRDLEQHNVIYAPTLKQSDKIQFVCRGLDSSGDVCGRRCRVKASSAGQEHRCHRCGSIGVVPVPKGKLSTGVVEKTVDVVEPKTVDFILDYLDHMRPDQQFLFEGRSQGQHVCEVHVNRIFNTYAQLAGLSGKLSFHTLRHYRGVKLYSLGKDLVLVKDGLRHKDIKSSQVYAGLDQEQKDDYRMKLNAKAFDPLRKRKSRAK